MKNIQFIKKKYFQVLKPLYSISIFNIVLVTITRLIKNKQKKILNQNRSLFSMQYHKIIIKRLKVVAPSIYLKSVKPYVLKKITKLNSNRAYQQFIGLRNSKRPLIVIVDEHFINQLQIK